MTATQHKVSIRAFARDMLTSCSDFTGRVQRFEERFGRASEDTLAVLAQAFYYCWFEDAYESDLVATCRAINLGKPTGFYLCGQVTPERWIDMHTYVVAVQRWLGYDLTLPREMNWEKIRNIRQWLGIPHPAKDWLAALFLCQLVDHLVLRTSFSKMGEDDMEEGHYTDYSPWYMRPDGPRYTMSAGDNDTPDVYVDLCKQHIRNAMSHSPEDAGELIANLVKPSQPPCMHRFSRYQDIKLTSIGALKWREQLPPSDLSRKKWETFWKGYEGAEASLRKWLDDVPAGGKLDMRLYGALGTATDRKRAIVRDFFLHTPASRSAYAWLGEYTLEHGLTPRTFLPDALISIS